jgi:hypothetical protein
MVPIHAKAFHLYERKAQKARGRAMWLRWPRYTVSRGKVPLTDHRHWKKPENGCPADLNHPRRLHHFAQIDRHFGTDYRCGQDAR